jgi:hypothetical protein
VQCLHLSPNLVARAVQHPRVGFVSFTGSVAGGRAVEQAATASATATSSAIPSEGIFPLSFKGVALELGGKDPAYVREDADLEYTVEQLVDGAFFNSGQSCCSIEVSCHCQFLGGCYVCCVWWSGWWLMPGGRFGGMGMRWLALHGPVLNMHNALSHARLYHIPAFNHHHGHPPSGQRCTQ